MKFSLRFAIWFLGLAVVFPCSRAVGQFGGSAASTNGAAAAAAHAAQVKKEKAKKAAIEAAAARDAQEAADAAAHPLPPDPTAIFVVHDGDPIQLRFVGDVSSKSAKVGDPVPMELAEDIKVGDVVVARAGTRAMAEVIWSQPAARMGVAGELEIRLDYLRIGNRKLHLRGTQDKEPGSAVGTVALDFFAGPVMIFKHGKQIEMKQGAIIKAYLGDDASLPPAPPAPIFPPA